VIDLEPAGGTRGSGAASARVGAKQVTLAMVALLTVVLLGGAVAGQRPPGAERPRHRLAFDQPSAGVEATVQPGAGESAAGVDGAEPTRPPSRIPGGWNWREVGPLSGRQGNVAVWTGSEVIYWGGDRPGRAPEGAAYDYKADRWRRLPRSPLTNRTGAGAVWTGKEVVIFGGVNGGGRLADGAAFDPATDRWRTIADSPLSGRVPMAVAWTGTEMLVVGSRGYGLFDGLQDVAGYDPARDSWRTLASLPFQINEGASVWTGSELVVYGKFLDRQRGVQGPDDRARGAAYDPANGHWRDLPLAPLSGQSIALAWNGSETIGWDHNRHSAAYDRLSNAWLALPDLPLEGRDCLPRGTSAGPTVFATHCGQAALFDRERWVWQAVEAPATAVDPPVWTGDGLVLWLAPSGRPDDGTWYRPMP
jgi:hypothetical protein